jgi:beta-phosphoglucomutase-like phosphatase (HAD superfamily)
MNLKPSQAIIIENSPLGGEAANNAVIPFIVALNNNTPLDFSSDHESLMRLDEYERLLGI